MSEQYPGGFITKTSPTVDGSTARGLWTLSQAAGYAKQGLWPTVPAAPTIGTATAGDASASVTFTAPSNIGSSAITSYTVTSSPGGFTGTGASSPITVSGLTNGTAYTFTVTATNGAGTGPASAASNSVTPAVPNYIEEVFNTYIYDGNGGTQSITNSVNLSANGGLVWVKQRSAAAPSGEHNLVDTVRGVSRVIRSDTTGNQSYYAGYTVTAFNTNGFTVTDIPSGGYGVNMSGFTYAAWTFRKQAKFFDVVTYTGTGSVQNINHNLGSTPGCIIVKDTTNSGSAWAVYHTSLGNTQYLQLQSTGAAATSSGYWNNTSPTSTQFTVGTNGNVNQTGATYIAYVFAHNAGGFGLTGTDNVISCGSVTNTAQQVNLGYEPQLIMYKTSGTTGNWNIFDNMRGMTADGSGAYLQANTSAAEATASGQPAPNATGFYWSGGAGSTCIYIAIRRGPMKTPTVATTVFSPYSATTPGSVAVTTSFPVDLQMQKNAGAATDMRFVDRLRGVSTTSTSPSAAFPFLVPSGTAAESTGTSTTLNWNNTGFTVGSTYAGSTPAWAANFRRAPGFFDEVCYTGTGVTNRVLNHNLTVTPEMIIYKTRSLATEEWGVYTASTGIGNVTWLNRVNATSAQAERTLAVSSTTITVGNNSEVNGSGATYVAYLFATCAGVSKVGSYTGTGATQTIACGFAAGARFVLIKRTDSTGDWYLWDSARGMVAGTDPSLLLNSTAAQVNANSVYAITTGFQIVSTAAGINASGGTYIFLAIA